MTPPEGDAAIDARERLNVIVFFTDQQRWDSVGLHGNPLGLTPTFDRIASQGTHLAKTFTPQPLCGPARACMQTGQYATQSGCWRNDIPLPEDLPTLAGSFGDAGYTTGYIGKWHLASEDPVPAGERGGYRHWLAANWLEFTSDAYDTVLFDGDGERRKLPGYRVDAVTDAAIRFVDDHQDEPFFLFVSHLEPHHQNHVDAYPAPTGSRERLEGRWTPPDLVELGGTTARHLAGYWGMVERLDAAFGRLLDALQSLDLLENTIVLFTSDHGCHFRTRNEEYKRSPHDASLRVPALLTGPGFDGGGTVQRLVSLLDLPPTLLDAAGIDVPESMEGRSLLPSLRGARSTDARGASSVGARDEGSADARDEIFFQISESCVGRGVRTQRWKYAVEAPEADPFEVPSVQRYVESHLYDLDYDPYELANLVDYASHAGVRAVLREKLLEHIARVESEQPEIVAAPERDPGYFDRRRVDEGEARQ